MKVALGFVALAMLAPLGLDAQAPGTVERELTVLENAWSTADVQRDSSFLNRLFADEYVSTDDEGGVRTKAEDIAIVASGEWQMTSFRLTDLRIQVHGNVAVVTGLNTNAGTWHGRDASGEYRFTDVFVRREGRWQCVATQATKVVHR